MSHKSELMQGKRILLISANVYKDPYPIYPLGISYLKTSLEDKFAGIEIDVADMNFISLAELSDKIKNGGYFSIGLSMRNIDDVSYHEQNYFVEWYKEIAGCVRASSDAVFHGGGAGFSIFPALLLDELDLDLGIKGEGESSMAQMFETLVKFGVHSGRELEELIRTDAPDQVKRNGICRALAGVEGLVWRNCMGEVVVNPRSHYETSLNLKFEKDSVGFYWEQSGMLNIQTKRGCPHHCIYCSYPVIEGGVVRTLDPQKIVNVLAELKRRYSINYVFFTDSVFNMRHSYNHELCNRMIDSGLDISWGAYFSPGSDLTYRELQLYKQSGLTHIEFGSESFSDTQLKNYGKHFTWSQILESSRICDSLGIFYSHFMILAGYGETEQTLQESYEHSRMLGKAVIFPYIGMRIYPGTVLAKIAVQEGIIKSEKDLLRPCFYISKDVDISKIKANAKATGANWVFSGELSHSIMDRYRRKKIRGPLWEYLRFAGFTDKNINNI